MIPALSLVCIHQKALFWSRLAFPGGWGWP